MIRSLQSLASRIRVSRFGTKNVEWLCRQEDGFRISRESDAAVPWKVKPIAELMFLLSALKRHGLNNRTLDNLSAGVMSEARSFDWHELAAYDPSAATGMALVADFFRSFNQPAPFDERYFRLLNDIDYFQGMDRLPYREMDLAWCLARTISVDYDKAIPAWFASTTFGRGQHVIRYTIDDIYSLTHAVFYLTDLGLRSPDGLLDAPVAARLREELAMLTAAMVRADNTDVLGELMLCWLFCGVEHTPLNRIIFDTALDVMMNAVTAEGAVAPMARIANQARSGKATFDQLYHTTLVGAFLFNLISAKHSYVLN